MGRQRLAAYLTSLVAAGLVAFGLSGPAGAAIANQAVVLSNNQTGATGVTYTATFQVGVAATDVIVALPSTVTGVSTSGVTVTTSAGGTSFSPALGASVLASSQNGPSKVGVNLTALTAGTWVRVAIPGLTNPGSAGDITVQLADGLGVIDQTGLDNLTGTLGLGGLISDVGNVTATIVDQVTNGTTTDLNVAPVLTLELGQAAHAVSVTPTSTGTPLSGQSDVVTVKTNAQTYTIEAEISGGGLLRQGGSGTGADVIPVALNDGSGPVTLSSSFTALGAALTGLTNGTPTTFSYTAPVDLTHPAGTYVGTITYRVSPDF